MEPLLVQIVGEEPVLYPPGHFGTGPLESQTTSTPETFYSDTMNEDPDELLDAYDAYDGERYHDFDDFPNYDSLSPPPEDTSVNAKLYRVYDVFIHKAPDPKASRQFYVLQDFDYGQDNEIVAYPSKFAVVTVINVRGI